MLPKLLLHRDKNPTERLQKWNHEAKRTLEEASLSDVSVSPGDDDANNKPPASTVSSLAIDIFGTVLEEDAIEALVDLINTCRMKGAKYYNESLPSLSSPVKIHFRDCNAVYVERPAIRKALAEALGHCQHVGFIESPTFLSKPFLEIFLASARNGGLKYLRITDKLDRERVEVLAEGLSSNVILRALDLSRSRLDDTIDFEILAKSLRDGGSNLKFLDFQRMKLRDAHLEAMLGCPLSSESLDADTACPIPALESLNLISNCLQDLSSIGNYLSHPGCNLQKLSIDCQGVSKDNKIFRFDIQKIANALETNKSLKTLTLRLNKLGDKGAIALANGLAKNSTLETLDVGTNRINDMGMAKLAKAVSCGHTSGKGLTWLGVSDNCFQVPGFQALLVLASKNHDILHIQDSGTLSCVAAEHIQAKIRYHTALNRGGRGPLQQKKGIPSALWPLVLGRSQKIGYWKKEESTPYGWIEEDFWIDNDLRSDILYYLLKEFSPKFLPSFAVHGG